MKARWLSSAGLLVSSEGSEALTPVDSLVICVWGASILCLVISALYTAVRMACHCSVCYGIAGYLPTFGGFAHACSRWPVRLWPWRCAACAHIVCVPASLPQDCSDASSLGSILSLAWFCVASVLCSLWALSCRVSSTASHWSHWSALPV
jgi:hypothetical protein